MAIGFMLPNVIINKNVVIHDNVTISNSIIMENCVIQSGARVGGTGFGFEMKTKQKINHTGNVIIGKNSSIGSNTTIDRAVFDSTIIGEFSNIDKYLILSSFSIWVSSNKFNSLISRASKSLSGSALNSSSGVFFVVSIHFSINIFKLSCNKFDEDIDDFSLEFDQDLEEKVNDVIDVDEEDVETSVSEEIVQEMDNSASGRLASLRDELDEDNVIEKRPLKDRMDDFFNS